MGFFFNRLSNDTYTSRVTDITITISIRKVLMCISITNSNTSPAHIGIPICPSCRSTV